MVGGDDLDSPRFPSFIICYLSSPPATKSVSSLVVVPAFSTDTPDNKSSEVNVFMYMVGWGVLMGVNGFNT